jgi:hypothetical protein
MKNALFFLPVFLFFLSCGSESNQSADDGKTKLQFRPFPSGKLKIDYKISVNNLSEGESTNYILKMSGKVDTLNNQALLELKNDAISMKGVLFNKEVSAEAGSPEKLPDTLHMVTAPVFSFLDKKFKSCYDQQLNKLWETQISDSGFVDSTENRFQIFLRYPQYGLAVGDSWEKDLVIKSGNKMNCAAKYTLKEIKGDKAVITVEGKLSGKAQSFGHDFVADGKLTGTFTVDIKTGWPLKSEVEQAFLLTMDGKESQFNYVISSEINY